MSTFTAIHPVLIRGVHEPFGWLGNMSPHPIRFGGETWRTAEALFQAMRFTDQNIRREIREAKSPMSAKMIAKRNAGSMATAPRSDDDLHAMRLVLHLKLHEHPDLIRLLMETGDRPIVEDCTKRQTTSGLFWGAAHVGNDEWRGENQLGKLWMELRDFPRTYRIVK